MNKVESQPASHQKLNYVVRRFSGSDSLDNEDLTCVACRATGRVNRAVGHTSHPEYRQLALYAACIAYYDQGVID